MVVVTRCSICTAGDVDTINAAILQHGIRAAARTYSGRFSRSALHRHKAHIEAPPAAPAIDDNAEETGRRLLMQAAGLTDPPAPHVPRIDPERLRIERENRERDLRAARQHEAAQRARGPIDTREEWQKRGW